MVSFDFAQDRLSMRVVKPSILFSSGCLAHLLTSDVSQVVVFVVRFMISPHDKNYLQPLCSQSSECFGMAVSFSPLVTIVFLRPLTAIERVKRKPIRGVAQQLIAGITKLYHTALATRFGYRDSTRLGLEVAKGLPSTLSISQLSPKHGYGGPTFSSRQRANKFSRRHRGEKTFNLLAVALYRLSQRPELDGEHQKQLRLGSDYVLGNRQLRLTKLLPQLLTALLAEVVLALGKAVPLATGKVRQSPWGGILLEKIQRNLRFQIRKDLQRPRVILFERHLDLVKEPSLVTPQPVVIAGEHLKLLSLFGVRLKSAQMSMIGPQKLCQHIRIKGIALGLAHAEPISGPIHSLGIDRIDHNSMVQKKINDPPVGLFDGSPKLYLFRLTLVEPATQFAHALGTLLCLHLCYFFALKITDPKLVKFIGPIHSHIVSLQIFLLHFCISHCNSSERKVRLISVLNRGTTFY